VGTIFNRKAQKPLRRQLRNTPTKAEAILWISLRRRDLLGYKFRRQHGIGPYIVDFYCPALKLVIEVDGATHEDNEVRVRDRIRQDEIESLGLKFVRLTDDEVLGNVEKAARKIEEFIKRNCNSTKSPPHPLLHEEGYHD
jgi:very-short-patch-repair endonuclease